MHAAQKQKMPDPTRLTKARAAAQGRGQRECVASEGGGWQALEWPPVRGRRRWRSPLPSPAPQTLQVRKSMNRIKQVMGERLREHEDPKTRAELKAFIDAL